MSSYISHKHILKKKCTFTIQNADAPQPNKLSTLQNRPLSNLNKCDSLANAKYNIVIHMYMLCLLLNNINTVNASYFLGFSHLYGHCLLKWHPAATPNALHYWFYGTPNQCIRRHVPDDNIYIRKSTQSICHSNSLVDIIYTLAVGAYIEIRILRIIIRKKKQLSLNSTKCYVLWSTGLARG